MKRIVEMGNKVLSPGWKWLVPLAAVSAALLFHVFTRGLQDTPIAYGTYTLSFYTTVVGTMALVREGRRLWMRLQAVPLAAHYSQDAYFRVRISLVLSFFINLCYAGLRIGSAVLYASFWDGALGVYYALLCVIRVYLIRKTKLPGETEPERQKQIQVRRRAGGLLLALALTLTWIAYQIVPIVQVVRYRQFRSPVLSAAKAVNLTSALVAIFSLETAMKYTFGGDKAFWRWMLPITAAAMCASVLLIALSMLRTPKRREDQSTKSS